MELGALKPGMTGRAELLVGEEHTAPRVGSGKVHVLATPVMINLIEAAALDAVERLLPPGYQSLGTLLQVRRSEEHTSELQSHHDLVCRLLLEKKKKKEQNKQKPSNKHITPQSTD